MRRLCCLVAGLVALAGTAQAGVIWNETGGDLSGNRLSPSAFTLAAGSNNLIGNVVSGDIDYVTLTVPVNTQMAQVILKTYASTDATAFTAVQQGATFTEPASGTNVANLLGYTHIGSGLVNTDILDNLAAGAGAQGFSPPLPANQYTFWIQQTGAALTSYEFDFVVAQVPEPSSGLLCGIASVAATIIALGARRQARPGRS